MNIISRKTIAIFTIAGSLFFAHSFGMQQKNKISSLTWKKMLQHGGTWEEIDILPWDQVKKSSWEENRPLAEMVFKQLLKVYCIEYVKRETPEKKQTLQWIALTLCNTLCKAFGNSLILHPKIKNKFILEIINVSWDLEQKTIPTPPTYISAQGEFDSE